MTDHQGVRSLPKFGEWDVNNPASAEGFTVIFTKTRDDKRCDAAGSSKNQPPPPPLPKKWFCCF